jgi:hypothetical protein
MLPYRMLPEYRGHAVILTSCERRSLTFLNSWGNKWGKNGSFSVENRSVLDLDRPEGPDIRFYDTYWNEDDLTEAENTAYKKNVDEDVKNRVDQHPSILEVEYKCPCCSGISPVMDFTGSIREALCAKCREIFAPEPGHLAQALHIRAGLGAVD